MKKTILALMLAAISGGVWAGWVKVAESDETIFYLDPATIRKDGNLRRAWEITDLKERDKDGEMSRRNFLEYDCKEGRSRFLSQTWHSEPLAGGKVLQTINTPGEWRYIAPGTVGDTKLKYVCAR